MPFVQRAADRAPISGRTFRFEGQAHGAKLSFFAVDIDPGAGVGQHVHPYSEIWVVREGQVTFEAGGEVLHAGPGDVVVVEPEMPHGFVNEGPGPLVMTCMHDSPTIIQHFLDPDGE